MKIPHSDLDKVFNLVDRPELLTMQINVTCTVIYSSNSTNYIRSLSGLTLEREYLYWTNNGTNTSSISKAYTQPFVKQVPLQTFAVVSPSGATCISANSAFLFFTSGKRLLAMNKHGYTGRYYEVASNMSSPSHILTYKDDFILVAED